MAVRDFGRPNADPRARRALAHTRIAHAGESDADWEQAKETVRATGDSRRSRDSGFAGALARLALQDGHTATIVRAGNIIVTDYENDRGGISAPSPDYLVGIRGVRTSRIAYRDEDGNFERYSDLNVVPHGCDKDLIADYPSSGYPIIPLDESAMRVDALAVRDMPVGSRVILAGLVERIIPRG